MLRPPVTRYAGFWRRLAAWLLDMLLATAVFICALLVWSGITAHQSAWDSPATLPLIAAVACGAFSLGIWLNTRLQGTPGKLLMGCLIVDAATGRRIGLGQSLLRSLAMLAAALPAGLGFLAIIWSSRRQGLHDRLSGTLVILEDDAHKSAARLAGESR
jgi:uncharacterized RDD family membrane protein YckC